MKSLLFIAVSSVILFTSCRFSECSNPGVALTYKLDSSGILLFEFDTYEKGSGFSKLLSSEQDSAHIDTFYHTQYSKETIVTSNHNQVNDNYDYIITIPATGKIYMISDISHSGKKKVKADGLFSENRTACRRTVSYNVNGQTFTTEGSTYEIGYSIPKSAEITITK